MAFDWSQKVVLITGASSGIGRALAVELGRRGAATALLARRAEKLREIVAEVEASGTSALALPADVRDAEAVRAAAGQALGRWGRIDVLIANAGMGSTLNVTDFRAAEAAEVIIVNTIGAINSVAAALPGMIGRGAGHLVAISSLAAFRGLPKSGHYSASKAALSTFFESLRVDLRNTGIYVTTIHPGFIKTPMTAPRKERMPFLLEVEDAARRIIHAIEAHRRTYAFPWQLALVVRLLALMPDVLYDHLMARVSYRE